MTAISISYSWLRNVQTLPAHDSKPPPKLIDAKLYFTQVEQPNSLKWKWWSLYPRLQSQYRDWGVEGRWCRWSHVVHLTPYFTDMLRRETIIYAAVSRISTDLFERKAHSELGKWNPIEKQQTSAIALPRRRSTVNWIDWFQSSDFNVMGKQWAACRTFLWIIARGCELLSTMDNWYNYIVTCYVKKRRRSWHYCKFSSTLFALAQVCSSSFH